MSKFSPFSKGRRCACGAGKTPYSCCVCEGLLCEECAVLYENWCFCRGCDLGVDSQSGVLAIRGEMAGRGAEHRRRRTVLKVLGRLWGDVPKMSLMELVEEALTGLQGSPYDATDEQLMIGLRDMRRRLEGAEGDDTAG